MANYQSNEKSGIGGRLIAIVILLLAAAALVWWFAGGGNPIPGFGSSSPTVPASGNQPALTGTEAKPGAITAKLDAIESRLQQMDELAASNAAAPVRAQAVVAALAARRSVEAGAGLGITEVQLDQQFGREYPDAVNAIKALGENPVTIQNLRDRFAQDAQSMIGRGPDVTLWDRVQLELDELFVTRRRGTPSPAPSQILFRAEQRLNNGDLQDAVDELQKLKATPERERWLAEAKRYITGQAALEQIEQAALSLSPTLSRLPAEMPIDASTDRGVQPTAPAQAATGSRPTVPLTRSPDVPE